jgi:hypothetical protein
MGVGGKDDLFLPFSFFDGYDSKLYPGPYHVVVVLTSDRYMPPSEPLPGPACR